MTVLTVLSGRGTVAAPECEMVRVRYHITVERRLDGVVAYGTLSGNPNGLHPIWLQPDALLQMEGRQRLNISVTDLIGADAMFESTGNVPEFKPKTKQVRKPLRPRGTGGG